MRAPQITLIVLYCISLGINLSEHGKPKQGKNNVFTSIVALIIQISILTWGGFFKW